MMLKLKRKQRSNCWKHRILQIGVLIFAVVSARGQGTFQNLDFEAALIVSDPSSPYSPYGIAVSNALPGWSVYLGNSQVSGVTYNDSGLGSAFLTLWATNGQNIEGNFSVLLQGGSSGPDASIRQTSLVPVLTQSLFFKAQPGNGSLVVYLNGQIVPFSAISAGDNYTLYGADVSAFAGQTAQLEFSALNGHSGAANNWNIDSIVFSQTTIPEPTTWSLMGLGAGMGLLKLKIKRVRLKK